MTTNNLSPDLRCLLEDLARQPDRPLSDDQRSLLLRSLERALVDPACLKPYLEHLQTLLGAGLPPEREGTDEEEQRRQEEERQVVDHGLSGLPPERLAQLALDPVALLGLRAAIFERDELPDYWWQRARESAQQRGRSRTPREVLDGVFGQTPGRVTPAPDEPGPGGSAREQVLAVALGGPGAAPSKQPAQGTAVVPLPELEWVDGTPPAPEDPEGQQLQVQWTLWPGQPRRLEVRLAGLAFLSPRAECTARLVDPAGAATLDQAGNQDGALTFTNVPEGDLRGLVLEGEYRLAGRLHFRFRVPLRQG
jgi:hypothetical protein